MFLALGMMEFGDVASRLVNQDDEDELPEEDQQLAREGDDDDLKEDLGGDTEETGV